MYNFRFQNRNGRRLFDWKGKFSLIHLGGGAFLYAYPGKYHQVVRRVELSGSGYRIASYGVLLFVALFASTILFSTIRGTVTALSKKGELLSAASLNLDRQDLGSVGIDSDGGFEAISEDEALEAAAAMSPEDAERIAEELRNRIVAAASAQRDRADQLQRERTLEIRTYRVRHGDTLTGIATRFGVPFEFIAASSGINIYSTLRPGQELTIPNKKGIVYRVKAGESLAAVASKYKVKLDELADENPDLATLDLVAPGTRLFLPNATIPEPPSPWVRPAAGRITSNFGYRTHPIRRTRHLHTGTDIGIYYGPVRAARDGRIVYGGRMGGYGNAIVIEHNEGYKTLYAHLSRINVRPGQYVRAGQVIAISGNTGVSTGPHLHFEVIRNGRPINPRSIIRF